MCHDRSEGIFDFANIFRELANDPCTQTSKIHLASQSEERIMQNNFCLEIPGEVQEPGISGFPNVNTSSEESLSRQNFVPSAI